MRLKLKDYLERYDQAGFCYIPVPYQSKIPEIEWKQYQTRKPTDAEKQSWFSNNHTNVAIVCGKVSGGEHWLVVTEVDSVPNFEGFKGIAEPKLGLNLADITPIVRTSRGYHIYWRVKQPVKSAKFPNLEIRSDGNYVIAPPSVHPSGSVYEWVNPQITEPFTIDSLLDIGIDVKQEKPQSQDGKPNWITEAMKGVKEGARDVTCARLAGYFLNSNPPDIVKTLLYPFAEKCEQPPNNTFTSKDVDKVVESINQKGCPTNGAISNIKDIGGKIASEQGSCERSGTSLGTKLGQVGGEGWEHGELAKRYDEFMEANREPHYKREVAEAIGTSYKDEAYRKILQRRHNEGGTRFLYGGDRIQYVNTDWKSSRVKFTTDNALPSLGLKLPFSMDFYVDILKKSTMTVEGELSSGKTHYSLEFASLNLGKLPIRLFFAELGTPRMLDLLRDYPNLLEAVKSESDDFILINTDINDLDVLTSLDPNGANLYDYLRMGGGERWWLDMQLRLRAFATKLENGFLMVNLQKLKGRSVAVGGEGNRFQCETAITLNTREVVQGSQEEAGYRLCRLDIEKARDWMGKIAPEAMSVDYRTGGERGRLYMIEHSWGLKSIKQKRDKERNT